MYVRNSNLKGGMLHNAAQYFTKNNREYDKYKTIKALVLKMLIVIVLSICFCTFKLIISPLPTWISFFHFQISGTLSGPSCR